MGYYTQVLKTKHRTDIIEEVKHQTIKIIDSTTISLCLGLFDWAKFRTAKGGIKIHTCWDDNLQIPDIINITETKTHDSKGFEQQVFRKDAIIVEDKGYFDFDLMLARIKAGNIFVTRIKDNTLYQSKEELELMRRNTCKTKQELSNFNEKIRICLIYYLTLEYVCNVIKSKVFRVRNKEPDRIHRFFSQMLKLSDDSDKIYKKLEFILVSKH